VSTAIASSQPNEETLRHLFATSIRFSIVTQMSYISRLVAESPIFPRLYFEPLLSAMKSAPAKFEQALQQVTSIEVVVRPDTVI
jgi:hypothetical protein